MPRNALKASLLDLKEDLKEVVSTGVFPELDDVDSKLDSIIADVDSTSDAALKEVVGGIHQNVSELEISHPRATSTLNQIMQLLSSLGI